MTDVHIVPATEAHAEWLAPRMRAADVAEVVAAGSVPHAALLDGMRGSRIALSAFYGNELGAIFGVHALSVGSALGGREIGSLWSLTGPAFGRYPIAFTKTSRRVVNMFLETWEELVNLVDARYAGALRLLLTLGAEFGSPVAFGPDNVSFIPFRIRRPT